MLNVMIADDEPLVRLMLKSMADWTQYGFTMKYEAENGREALALITDRTDVDIILLDLYMPVMNGLEFLSALEGVERKPEIIILSAHKHFDDVRKAFKLGSLDYIVKSEAEEETVLAALQTAEIYLQNQQEKAFSGQLLENMPGNSERKETTLIPRDAYLNLLMEGAVQYMKEDLLSAFNIELPLPFVIGIEHEDIAIPRSSQKLREPLALSMKDIAEQVISDEILVVAAFYNNDYRLVVLVSPRHLPKQNNKNLASSAQASEAEAIAVLSDELETAVKDMFRKIENEICSFTNRKIQFNLSRPIYTFKEIPLIYRDLLTRSTVISRAVYRACSYIQCNYDNPELTLVEVSRYADVSPAHLSGRFVVETGYTYTHFTALTRINAAIDLMKTSTDKLYIISESVGFKSLESFHRVFRKITGVSPRKYSLH